MADNVFLDENAYVEFDFSKANNVIRLHEKYQGNILSDVDFIIEQADRILLVEYKNSDVSNASNPKAFDDKIKTDTHYNKIARKYYDSVIYIMVCEKAGPLEYIYILEAANADIVIRKWIAAKIKRLLPFQLQKDNREIKRQLIHEFYVLNIDEWNQKFPDYPIRPITMRV